MNEGELFKKVCLNVFASAKSAKFVGIVDQNGKLLLGKYRHWRQNDSLALLIRSSIFYSHYLFPTIEKNRNANKIRESTSNDVSRKELEEPYFELVDLWEGDSMKLIITPLTNKYDRYLCIYLELLPQFFAAPIAHHDTIDSI